MRQLQEDNFKRALGLRIMVQRQKIRMSQKELGARIGVSGQQMQKYENGINSMSPYRLTLCAEILEKPISYFYGDGEEESISDNVNILRITSELEQLPDEAVETVLNMVKQMHKMASLYDTGYGTTNTV